MTLRPFSTTLQGNYRDVFQTPGSPEVIDDDEQITGVVNIRENYTSEGAVWVDQVAKRTITLASATASNSTGTMVTASGKGLRVSVLTCTANHLAATGGTVTLNINGSAIWTRPSAIAASTAIVIQFPAGREPLVPSGGTVTVVSNNANAEGYASVAYFLE